jgi:hypothetical protein
MRSHMVFALIALFSLGLAAARSAPSPSPSVPGRVNPLVVAISEERAQLVAECASKHLGSLVRAYPNPKYPDSFQMTAIECEHGFLVESWDAARLQRSH